jgi:hypothetical protein
MYAEAIGRQRKIAPEYREHAGAVDLSPVDYDRAVRCEPRISDLVARDCPGIAAAPSPRPTRPAAHENTPEETGER